MLRNQTGSVLYPSVVCVMIMLIVYWNSFRPAIILIVRSIKGSIVVVWRNT